uniref:Uncharacterized protein n=1 Tax=Vespula pensylvanica TaxID=30213 RepID=A0A834P8J2_VESPE|nr:hypothetical protein H0235_005023 [Vespula pensylvanica]
MAAVRMTHQDGDRGLIPAPSILRISTENYETVEQKLMAGEPSDGRHFERQRSHSLNETTLRLANSTNDSYYYYFPVLLNFIKKDY